MADPNKYRLKPDEIDDLYEIISFIYLSGRSSQEFPRLGIISAQTGAGKSGLFAIVKQQFKEDEDPVHTDMDQLREMNPKYVSVFEAHPFETAFYTNEDAWICTSRLLDDAKDSRYNVLYETALKSVDGITETAKSYKTAGYTIELHALAVNSKQSVFGVFNRFEDALKDNKPARFVAIDYHDLSNELLPLHVDKLEKSGLMDSVSVWLRVSRTVCDRIYVNDGTYPGLAAKDVMEKERSRLWTVEEKQGHLKNWQQLFKRINARPEGPTKPDWYVKAARHFLKEARLFAKAQQATDKDAFDPSKIKAVTHHHIFVRTEDNGLLCFDRKEFEGMIAPHRGKVFAPPKASKKHTL